ncbi:MAG: M60 family metallopeptidase [Bacteroidaceae bacterium]|nr:M60 family metallopeptidase [Bacteroidaceae bacterium]
MKLFTQWRFTLLSALFFLIGMGSAWAQLTELEEGKVYHFTNVGYPEKSMGATNSQSVAGVAKDTTNKAQLWYVESKGDNGYALRNLGYGTYLQANGQSTRWTLASTTNADNSWIKLETKDSNNAFKGYTYGNYGYAHIDGSSNIVGWETGATATQWTITKKEMTSAEIEEALNIFTSVPTIQEHLDNLFSDNDKSCTTLKGEFDENNASYQALPTTLQAMVRKVAGNTTWDETNFDESKAKWDAEYAKKYRIQLYEPYNEPECAASALGLNAHTNLNNPTGIFANNGDIVYVMVESEIKAGSSLYLTYHIGHGELSGYANGWELHQGLNVIPVYNDETNFCINYVVHTFDTSKGKGNKAKARKLSDYKPIKIHIEGGHINGYWNKVGDDLYAADNNDSWNYIEARATQKTVTVLGKYITLQFPLLDENTVTNDSETQKGLASYFNELVKIEDCINEWDNVMLWERLLLGIMDEQTILKEAKKSPYSDKSTVFEYTGNDGEFESDYSDYYNIHGLSYGIPNSYMYGGWAHCGYNYGTMDGVIKNLPTDAGSHWGPGHEIGHQHQGLLTVNGLTEVTNNLFANVVLWYYGETTSRYNGSEGALSNVLAQFNAEGTDFFSNNIWAQTIMYYKLFLYYHVLGHNPKFYPRLFEMLRQDPMSTGYAQDGSTCLMHFYKKCCLAAGEDLTEFFRAHGFLEVMDNRFVGDYSNSVYNLTQAQIDAAIQEVKNLGYKENIAVLFITDATGETIKSYKGDNLDLYGETTVCAEVGCYANFNSEPSNYTYSISGTTVTMEGSGGVGFAILNENGELLGFSDKKTFEISAEAAAAIASGEASIVTLKGDNTQVATTNVMDAGDNETKYELLGNLLDDAKAVLDLSDETGTKVGYYRTSALTDLQTAYTTAKGVYDAKTVAAYSSVYDVLFQEYANLINNEYARINITEGYAYRLTNKAYPDRSMAVNTENHQMFGLATAESDAQLWYFEPGATKGTYYLKNKSTQQYPGDVSTSAVLSANKSEADKGKDNGAYAYRLQSMGNGIFALVGSTGLHCSSSQDYNIVGWGTDADATQWYITAEVVDETLEARLKLEETIAKTEALVNEMAEVKIKGSALDLTTCTITSNTPETGHETKYLVDSNPETFFHTNWTGTAISENHNFIIDLGEGNSLEQFAFNYITLPTSAYNVDAPKTMVIEGSTDGIDYTSITSLSGLPTTKDATYASTTLGTKGAAYRYLRFSVTDATGGKLGNYYYFGIAEFGLTNMQTELLSVKDGYSTSQTAILDACDGLYAANLVYNNETATQEELQAAASALNAYYEALLNAYNEVKDAGLDAKKTELQTLINNTTTLIGQCGSVVYTEETTPQLNTSAAPYKLSDNNGTSEGSLDKLYDGKQGKDYSYTSNWSNTPTQASYLQVDLGSGNELEELIFTFTNRNEGNAPTPTEIVVSASADGNTFTPLVTYTSEETNWPPAANNQNIAATKWTSPVIEATSACRYWRFTVTKSQRSSGGETNNKGIYHFGISEFGIVIPANCKVTVNEGLGEVTEELLLATYDENQEAQSTHTYATTEAQLDKAIAELQAQYDALKTAYNALAPELQAAMEAAQTFLNATPQTVGYPSATQRNAFQTAIDAHESVEAINTAKTEFINTTDIVMPENSKAYKISAWWRNETRSMEFVGTENTSIFAGSVPAYVPTTSETATIFVCRDLGNGEYAFISDNGYYLGWQADGKKNNTSTSFSVNSYNNTLKVQKAVPNNMDTMLSSEEVFGTFNILGKNGDESGKYYHFMFKKSSKNYHSGNEGDAHYGDDAHTVFYTFEEVSGYTLNKVNLTATSTDKDKLLKGITDQQTISTFSAPYATVIPEGVTAYYATQEYTGSTLYLKAIEEGLALPANEGVILVGNVDVKASDFVPATTETVAVIDNKFSNSAAASVVMENNDYILANGNEGIGIYKAQAGTRLKQGKAFLRMGSTSNAPSFIMNFGGNATGVEITLTDGATGEQVVYDLYGRRVTEVTKGRLYIVNGKKVFIK